MTGPLKQAPDGARQNGNLLNRVTVHKHARNTYILYFTKQLLPTQTAYVTHDSELLLSPLISLVRTQDIKALRPLMKLCPPPSQGGLAILRNLKKIELYPINRRPTTAYTPPENAIKNIVINSPICSLKEGYPNETPRDRRTPIRCNR